MRLARRGKGILCRLEWLQPSRSICGDSEMASERRTDVCGASLWVNLLESVNPMVDNLPIYEPDN